MTAAWLVAVTIAAAADGLPQVWACLDRGDAVGAQAALAPVGRPSDDTALASWLDARCRLAWAAGRMDEAFALGVQAVALSERTGRSVPTLTPALAPRDWIDEATGLPRLVVPTGDGDGRALAQELLALPEASTPDGAWIVCAARLLDAGAAEVAPERSANGSQRRERRLALLRAAVQARRGEGKAASSACSALRAAAKDGAPIEGLARWFEAEGTARGGSPVDVRAAALRYVQAAAAFDDSPWLRARALQRAAGLLDAIDPPEAARLRAAALQETPG